MKTSAYLQVRQLEPSHAEAGAGLERSEAVLERRRRELLEQTRVREEAVKFLKPAYVEWTRGDVRILGERTRDVVKTGQELHPGYGLETVGAESFSRIKYLNAIAMELDADTLIHQWLEEPVSARPNAVSIKKGALRVSIPSASPGKPLVFSTPHLEVQGAPSLFRVMVTPKSTRVVVESGALQVTRRADGSKVLIERGFALDCEGLGAMTAQPICAPGGRLVADFDSHVGIDWVPAQESSHGSLSRSVVHPGLQGSGALQLEYSVPASEMVWITQAYSAPEDWSAHPGISFWFKGTQSQTQIVVELWENRDPAKRAFESERFWYRLKDDFVGWRKFDVRWAEFRRRPFPSTPDDGFTQKEMWGVTIIIQGNGQPRRGRCEFDQIELLPLAPQGSRR